MLRFDVHQLSAASMHAITIPAPTLSHAAQPTARQLLWPATISLALHLIAFSFVNNADRPELSHAPHHLSVTLVQASSPQHRLTPETTSPQNGIATQVLTSAEVLDSNASDYRLDIDQLRSQAHEYASQELATSTPAIPLDGDYFGTYAGDDSGIFFFHLDSTGHASGSGQSDTRGIAFLIEGDVKDNGVIRMVGSRKEGDSKFVGQMNGQLNIKTGKIAGSWSVPGFLKGSFSGQQDLQISMN